MTAYAEFQRFVLAFVLCALRVGTAMALLPAMSSALIGGVVRRMVTLAFAFLILPVAMDWMPPGELHMGLLCVIGLKEVVIGAIIGFVASIPFTIAENVGDFIDNQRGATMGELFSPLSGTQVSVLGTFFTQLVAVIFYAGGAVAVFLAVVYMSYDVLPLFGGVSVASNTPEVALGLLDTMTERTFMISAPIVIIMLLATIGLGFVNRTAPQLNVFFLSMPIKSALGLAILAIYLQFVIRELMYTEEGAIFGPVLQLLR